MKTSPERNRLLSFVFIIFFVPMTILFIRTDITEAQCAPGAGGFVPLECFQQSRKLQDAYNSTELGPFIQKAFVGAISIGAMLAVLRLAWGGFRYMSSDIWGTKEHAKEIIRETLLGLFLLLAIYLILRQINPQILELKVNPESSLDAQEQPANQFERTLNAQEQPSNIFYG